MTEEESATMYAEVWEILKRQPKYIVDKIPKCLLEKIENKRDKKNTFKFDCNKNLTEQDITFVTQAC
ncbi:MAG: hypothetical protein IJS61_00455 [Firmicutes bacterium]|nr:hypothetical protein [Bacillota bacterium]